MSYLNKKAFTLIELMISITIVVLLTLTAYAPYNYYQNKAKLKISVREVSQALHEARNMAVNWVIWLNSNVSVWVYMESGLTNNQLKFYSYPYDIENTDIFYEETSDIKLLKKIELDKGVQVDDISWKENILFYFQAITWSWYYYTWDWPSRSSLVEDTIDINLSYKWSSSDTLKRKVSYFTSTNITDY